MHRVIKHQQRSLSAHLMIEFVFKHLQHVSKFFEVEVGRQVLTILLNCLEPLGEQSHSECDVPTCVRIDLVKDDVEEDRDKLGVPAQLVCCLQQGLIVGELLKAATFHFLEDSL